MHGCQLASNGNTSPGNGKKTVTHTRTHVCTNTRLYVYINKDHFHEVVSSGPPKLESLSAKKVHDILVS